MLVHTFEKKNTLVLVNSNSNVSRVFVVAKTNKKPPKTFLLS